MPSRRPPKRARETVPPDESVRRAIASVTSPGATHFHPFSRSPARCEPHGCPRNDTLKSRNAAGDLWHAHRCDSSYIRAEARLAPGMNEADTCCKQVVPLLQNLQYRRQFYLAFPPDKICQTVSGKSALNIRSTLPSKSETLSRIFTLDALAATGSA